LTYASRKLAGGDRPGRCVLAFLRRLAARG
jgi:hypothetical protein